MAPAVPALRCCCHVVLLVHCPVVLAVGGGQGGQQQLSAVCRGEHTTEDTPPHPTTSASPAVRAPTPSPLPRPDEPRRPPPRSSSAAYFSYY